MLYSVTLKYEDIIADINALPLATHSLALRVFESSSFLKIYRIAFPILGILKAPPTTSTE